MALRRPPTRIELRADDIAEYTEVSIYRKAVAIASAVSIAVHRDGEEL